VTIIEFGDYQCPACRRWQPQIEEVLREYPDEVAFIYRHWPLPYHEHAYPAARAAECAGAQGAFWAFHRQLFEEENWHDDAMTRFAKEVGVNDLDEFGRCLGDSSPVPAIEAGIEAAREIDAAGTPAVIVNGVLLASPPDSQTLKMMIQEGQ
jgi:protein-disulfide isomerase